MEYIIEGELVDTYGGDFTYMDVYYEGGKFYKSYYGAKSFSDAGEVYDEEELLKYKEALSSRLQVKVNEKGITEIYNSNGKKIGSQG